MFRTTFLLSVRSVEGQLTRQNFNWLKVYPLPDGQAVNDKPEKPIPIQNQPAEDLNQQQSVDSGNTKCLAVKFLR